MSADNNDMENQPLLGQPGSYNQQFQEPLEPYNQLYSGQQGQQNPPYLEPNPILYANSQNTVILQSQVPQIYIGSRRYLNFTGAIILSCFVYWCCGWIFGLIAFILAMIGETSAAEGDNNSARSLLISSYILSAIGLAVGTAALIFVIVYITVYLKKIK